MKRQFICILILVFTLNTFAQDFSARWNTTNTDNNSTLDNQIEIPTNPALTYNYTVNWGDGITLMIIRVESVQICAPTLSRT